MGSSDIYGYWIDMNEPSVFDAEEQTLPRDSIHIDAKNRSLEHRNLHNAYGLLMAQTTYRGSLARDQEE